MKESVLAWRKPQLPPLSIGGIIKKNEREEMREWLFRS